MKNAYFDGIEGLEGRVPFGAIVSVGIKGPSGNPTRTNRFFINSTGYEGSDGKGYRNLKHPLDPRFAKFNSRPDAEASTLSGNLVLPSRQDCVNVMLAAQQLGSGRGTPPGGGTWETPPRAMPACTGDGKMAKRYAGMVSGSPHFIDIPCPNRLCAFRVGPKKICGAFGRLYFKLRWPDEDRRMPSLLVRYQTHGWETAENMKGMFDAVESIADGLGMPRDSWCYTGLPFDMSLGIKKIPDKGQSFPVVSFALGDVTEFLRWQAESRKYLADAPRSVVLIGEGMKHDEGSLEGVGDALAMLIPGQGIPATVDDAVIDVEPELEPEPATDSQPTPTPAVDPPAGYVIAPDDPRSPYDRLVEFAKEALHLGKEEFKAAIVAVMGSVTQDIPDDREAQIACELEKIAASRGA